MIRKDDPNYENLCLVELQFIFQYFCFIFFSFLQEKEGMPAFPARRKQVSMIGQTGVVLGGWAAMHETGIKIKKN